MGGGSKISNFYFSANFAEIWFVVASGGSSQRCILEGFCFSIESGIFRGNFAILKTWFFQLWPIPSRVAPSERCVTVLLFINTNVHRSAPLHWKIAALPLLHLKYSGATATDTHFYILVALPLPLLIDITPLHYPLLFCFAYFSAKCNILSDIYQVIYPIFFVRNYL